MPIPPIHHLNIGLHVGAGSAAILIGSAQFALAKGGSPHRFRGRIAITLMTIAVSAAILGAFLFRGKVDLMGLSLLVAYQLYSAIRSLKLKRNGRLVADIAPALLALGSGVLGFC